MQMNDLYVHQLETENKQLREALQQTRKVLEEQTKTIDKAIEYITTEQLYTNYQWGKSQYAKILKDLLEILGDKE